MRRELFLLFLTIWAKGNCQSGSWAERQKCLKNDTCYKQVLDKNGGIDSPDLKKTEEETLKPPPSCVSDNGTKGFCVDPSQCSKDGIILKHGESHIKERFGGTDGCTTPMVCCFLTSTSNKNSDETKKPEENLKLPPSCISDNGTRGFCVDPSQCSRDGIILKRGESHLMKRFGETSVCTTPTVCCFLPSTSKKDSEVTEKPTISEPDIRRPKECLTENNEQGACVNYYICYNGTIDTTGRGRLIPRVGGTSGDSCKISEVCCRLPKGHTHTTTTETDTKLIEQSYISSGCGRRHSEGIITARITNGVDSKFGEFPWVVGIYRGDSNDKTNNNLIGGGSLINTRVVITAAHTVAKDTSNALSIRAGDWVTTKDALETTRQDRAVKEIILHENFDSNSLVNDIAILILNNAVILNGYIELICLPKPSLDAPLGDCIATGWEDRTIQNSSKALRKVSLPIVERNTCEKKYKSTKVGYFFELDESFICAGGIAGQDVCIGDGGSPLVCPDPDKPNVYFQSGIVSWGLECGTEGIPSIYTNVGYLREWIDEKLMINKLL